MINNISTIKFSRNDTKKFFKTLNNRVSQYFKENKLSKTGNWRLYLKTFIMMTMFMVPYFIIMIVDLNHWIQLLLTVIIGIGLAGVGMNVMHDGNHGSYSKHKIINKIMGGTIYILAGNVYNWQVQHNVLHHTYTNIHGHDEDLEAGRILRFSKHSPWKRFHKFQHYYSLLVYGLLTINWSITTDFFQTKRYLKRKLSYGKMPNPKIQWSILLISKIIYLTIWLIIPTVILKISFWKIFIGFFVMHYTAGLILSVIFQLAHITEDTEMPLPDNTGGIKNTWAIHQLFTTVNFSTKSRFLNWFSGGLNFQVEHHIFPNISHIHYKNISKIVKQTTKEFNLPYNEYKTFVDALSAHFRYLKTMSMKPQNI